MWHRDLNFLGLLGKKNVYDDARVRYARVRYIRVFFFLSHIFL